MQELRQQTTDNSRLVFSTNASPQDRYDSLRRLNLDDPTDDPDFQRMDREMRANRATGL